MRRTVWRRARPVSHRSERSPYCSKVSKGSNWRAWRLLERIGRSRSCTCLRRHENWQTPKTQEQWQTTAAGRRPLSAYQPEGASLVEDGSHVPTGPVAIAEKETIESFSNQEDVTGTKDTTRVKPVARPKRGLFPVLHGWDRQAGKLYNMRANVGPQDLRDVHYTCPNALFVEIKIKAVRPVQKLA